jgi:hypothetical protein
MRPRVIGVLWVLVGLAFVALLAYEVSKMRQLNAELARAETERQRLAAEITSRQKQIAEEMSKSSGVIQEMQWSAEGTDPSAFLTRMAELAREKRVTILGIGPLERQSGPQFTKSWHTVQVQAPYREVRDMAARVEEDRGIIENLHLEPAPPVPDASAPAGRPKPADEVRARFRMTALELTPQAKLIIERARAAGGGGAPGTGGLTLPVPSASGTPASPARDPFAFLAPPTRPAAPPAASTPAAGQPGTGPAAPEAPPVPLDVKGIVSFPDGFLAIVNNQIVKVGDTVSGYQVDRITEGSVTLSRSGASPRTINLPELAPPPAPAAPRR